MTNFYSKVNTRMDRAFEEKIEGIKGEINQLESEIEQAIDDGAKAQVEQAMLSTILNKNPLPNFDFESKRNRLRDQLSKAAKTHDSAEQKLAGKRKELEDYEQLLHRYKETAHHC